MPCEWASCNAEAILRNGRRVKGTVLKGLDGERMDRFRTKLTEVAEAALQGLRVDTEVPDALVDIEPLPVIRGDRAQLVTLFEALLSNAITFQDAAPYVMVRAGLSTSEEHVLVQVIDNGIGVPVALSEEALLPFRQLHARGRYPGLEAPAKKETHRALDDILESIEELRFYRRALFRDEPAAG